MCLIHNIRYCAADSLYYRLRRFWPLSANCSSALPCRQNPQKSSPSANLPAESYKSMPDGTPTRTVQYVECGQKPIRRLIPILLLLKEHAISSLNHQYPAIWLGERKNCRLQEAQSGDATNRLEKRGESDVTRRITIMLNSSHGGSRWETVPWLPGHALSNKAGK